MKKALGVLFARPYRSHEAHGTFGPWRVCPGAVSTPSPAPCLLAGWTAAKAVRRRCRCPVLLAHEARHSGAARWKRCLSVPQGVLARSLDGCLPLAGEMFPGGSVRRCPVLGLDRAPGAAGVCRENSLPVAQNPLLLSWKRSPLLSTCGWDRPVFGPPPLTRHTPQASQAGRGPSSTVGLRGHPHLHHVLISSVDTPFHCPREQRAPASLFNVARGPSTER